MLLHRSALVITAVFALSMAGTNSYADDAKKVSVTTIKVDDMCCGGCAKKVQQFVAKVSGVEKVETDLMTHTVKVSPKANAKVSAKEMWEAVEKAGYTPSEIDGPSGSLKEKPKS